MLRKCKNHDKLPLSIYVKQWKLERDIYLGKEKLRARRDIRKIIIGSYGRYHSVKDKNCIY
jgi:hypothetical protein